VPNGKADIRCFQKRRKKIMRKHFIGLTAVGIFMIGMWLLGSAPQATAETMNFKSFTHVTKAEAIPIADVEGHALVLTVREGVAVFQNGEWAWAKSTGYRDLVRGAGTGDNYTTYTFFDGSTFTLHRKGTVEATPQGVTSGSAWTGDVTHGTGRFQGIKGTMTMSAKILPLEKGEQVGKALSEGTLEYTLPGK
jgi:hypothetical protein